MTLAAINKLSNKYFTGYFLLETIPPTFPAQR